MVPPRLRPSIVVVLAAATALGVFAAARRAAQAWLGPTGFHYVITEPDGSVRRGTSAYAIAPEVVPSPQPGGSLVLTTTLLVDRGGRYALYLGSSTHAELVVDGRTVFQPPPGLVRPVEQQLGAGPHAVVVRMPKADREGTIAFAIRPPGEEWRARLVDAGDTSRLSPDEFRARVGGHFVAYRTAVRVAPYAAVCVLVAVALALVGRRRLVDLARAYRADAGVQRTLTLLAFVAIVLPMVSPLFAPGFYFCHEGEGYAIRLAQYAASLRAGVPMGRWWPDPVLGRGYPFLCLYAPLLYLIATPFLLVGFAAISVVKIITAAALMGGACATF
jgi:hypothetical protein